MGVKVKLKKPKRYRIELTLSYDGKPNHVFSKEGDAKDMGAFMDEVDEMADVSDEMDDDGLREVTLRVARL